MLFAAIRLTGTASARQDFAKVDASMLASCCRGVIAGFGMHSYRLAIESFLI